MSIFDKLSRWITNSMLPEEKHTFIDAYAQRFIWPVWDRLKIKGVSEEECLVLTILATDLCQGFELPCYWLNRMADEIESGKSYDEVLIYYQQLR